MSLEPIQWERYNQEPRLEINDFVIPIYRYHGYLKNRMMARGSDERHVKSNRFSRSIQIKKYRDEKYEDIKIL